MNAATGMVMLKDGVIEEIINMIKKSFIFGLIFLFLISVVSAETIVTFPGTTIEGYDIDKTVEENGCMFGASDAEAGKGSSPYTIITKANQLRDAGANAITRAINKDRSVFIKSYKQCFYAEASISSITVGTTRTSYKGMVSSRDDIGLVGYALGYTHGFAHKSKNHYALDFLGEKEVLGNFEFHEDVAETIPEGITGKMINKYKALFERVYRDGYAEGRKASRLV